MFIAVHHNHVFLTVCNLDRQNLIVKEPETAENVAEKYQISREDQDAFALRSQQKTAAAQPVLRFKLLIYKAPANSGVINFRGSAKRFSRFSLYKWLKRNTAPTACLKLLKM
jgi:hypothetical protein